MNIEIMENEFLRIEIKTHGAELISIFSKRLNKEVLWEGEKDVWPRHSPVLFPIVGKLKNDQFEYENQKYHLKQHGFARDLEHSKIDVGTYVLKFNAETLKMYPFKFSLETKYELIANKLLIHFLVKNLDSKKIFYSLGAHPGFKLYSNDSEIKFECNEDYYLLESGLVNFEKKYSIEHKKLHLNHDTFINDALIFKNLNSKFISLVCNEFKIRMNIQGFSYFGIWGKDNRFVCLEPWWGIADTIHNNGKLVDKEGIKELGPGENERMSYSLEIEV